MKIKNCDFWRDVSLIVLVVGTVYIAVSVLLHTRYSNEFPDVVQDWAPPILFIVTVWHLIADRLKNPPDQPGQGFAPVGIASSQARALAIIPNDYLIQSA